MSLFLTLSAVVLGRIFTLSKKYNFFASPQKEGGGVGRKEKIYTPVLHISFGYYY